MILFNYAMSPYAEKMRLMLGYCNLPWQSVKVPPMPPRKGLDTLTGGYRRIPVAQIGADIFCDSRIIAGEIAQLAGKPELSLDSCAEDAQAFATSLEREYFFAAVRAVPPRAMLKRVVREHLPYTIYKLLQDRARMARNAAIKMPGARRSADLYAELLPHLEAHLHGQFLFGDTPCIADFSAYHMVWFNGELGRQKLPAELKQLQAWYQRMHNFGHGQRQHKPMRYALQLAADSEPRSIQGDCQPVPDGPTVTIAPTDYGHDGVSGQLVAESDLRWILLRETSECGRVHVHFPKSGYACE